MTEYLFIGGAGDGLWKTVPAEQPIYHIAVVPQLTRVMDPAALTVMDASAYRPHEFRTEGISVKVYIDTKLGGTLAGLHRLIQYYRPCCPRCGLKEE